MTGCRIGRVTVKGGAQLLRLPINERDEVETSLSRSTTNLLEDFHADGMAGFAVIAWGFDGQYSVGYAVHTDSNVGFGMMPSFVADALRRRMIEEGEWS